MLRFKEILGMWIGENKSAKCWLSVMNGLKNRGFQDIKAFMTTDISKDMDKDFHHVQWAGKEYIMSLSQ